MKVRMRICFLLICLLLTGIIISCIYLYNKKDSLNNQEAVLESESAVSTQQSLEAANQNPMPIKNSYYLTIEDGKIVVYRGNQKTIYLKTSITQEEISRSSLKELKTGIYVENQKQVYDYLESCTS